MRQQETGLLTVLYCVCRYYPFPTGDWSVTADFLKCPTPTNHKSWACTRGRSSSLMTSWWYEMHYFSRHIENTLRYSTEVTVYALLFCSQVTKIFQKKKNSVTYSFRQSFSLYGMQVLLFENQCKWRGDFCGSSEGFSLLQTILVR